MTNSIKTIFKRYYTISEQLYTAQIKNATVICQDHWTPKIKLRLVTAQYELWHLPVDRYNLLTHSGHIIDLDAKQFLFVSCRSNKNDLLALFLVLFSNCKQYDMYTIVH